MGVKGSLKDRIRFWSYQKRKRKKNREYEELLQFQKEKQKQGIYIQFPTKKYNRFHQFFSIFFGFFINLFHPIKKTEKTPINEEQLLNEIIDLQEAIEKLPPKESLQVYYQKIEQKEKQLGQMEKKESKILLQCKQHIEEMKQTIEKQQEKIVLESKEQTRKQSSVNVPKEKNEETQKKQIENQTLEPNKTSAVPFQPEKGIHFQNKETKIEHITTPQNRSNFGFTKDIQTSINNPNPIDYKKYLVDTNKKLKQKKKELQKIKEELQRPHSKQTQYQLESDLLWIQHQLHTLETAYQEISKDKEFEYLKNKVEYYQEDSANLLKNDGEIQELLKTCKALLERKIPSYNLEMPTKTVETKEEEIRQEKNKTEFYLEVEDFQNMRASILEDMRRQMQELNGIPLPTKTPTMGFFQKIKNFISSTALAILPTVFFKNKLVGVLTSSIIMHNRVRSMKKQITQEEVTYEYGETLFQTIKTKQDCLQAIYMHMTISMNEIEQLKQDFIYKYQVDYPVEVNEILMQFQSLENQILEQANILKMNQQKLLKTKQKYQKVLKK